MYERQDWTLFRSLDTLCQQAGVDKYRIAALVAKELADNALDVCGSCRIGYIGENGFFVEDDGEGIDSDQLSKLFSINRGMVSTKLLRLPTRGALGNGLRVVTGAIISTGGSLVVKTRGKEYRVYPQPDGATSIEIIGEYEGTGTSIEVQLGKSAGAVDLNWAQRSRIFSSGETYKGKTSPFWYTSEAFYELVQADTSGRSVRDFVSDFDGCSGKKAGDIAADFKGRVLNTLTREEADQLLLMMRDGAKPVKAERLGNVGKDNELLTQNYSKVSGSFVSRSALGNVHAEIPFIVEAWAEISDKARLLGHVNRSPICTHLYATHVKKLDIWGCGLYQEFTVGQKPMRIWLNVITPYMPITNSSKQPDFTPMREQIYEAIQKAINQAKRNSPELAEVASIKSISQKDAVLNSINFAIDKASGGGEYRFSQRQLYYVVRPLVMEATGKELQYKNFESIVTDYEAEHGDIEGMYRDPRGIIYHPHIGQDIPLGTLSVEEYNRPAWTFNKILFIEKEGFFATLKSIKWPERNDCALITSKGQPTRAARDILDLLGQTEEEITFFCIHDADAAGTIIYQTLQEGTKARPGLKVEVINLGLEPEEAIEMGLEIENTNYSDRKAVADYVPYEWHEWLQNHRVELNAMTTPQFIEWLDRKMTKYNKGKVIPPNDILWRRLREETRNQLRGNITNRILTEANIDELVNDAYQIIKPVLYERSETLAEEVREALEESPADQWTVPVDRISKEVSKDV